MLSNLGRFAAALMRRRSAWLGFVMFVLPPAERLVYPKMLPAEDDVWLSIAGALLLLWAAFRAWEEQPSAISLENDPPPVQPKRRSLNSDQRVALLGALKNSGNLSESFSSIIISTTKQRSTRTNSPPPYRRSDSPVMPYPRTIFPPIWKAS